jgi:hypothetical protein
VPPGESASASRWRDLKPSPESPQFQPPLANADHPPGQESAWPLSDRQIPPPPGTPQGAHGQFLHIFTGRVTGVWAVPPLITLRALALGARPPEILPRLREEDAAFGKGQPLILALPQFPFPATSCAPPSRNREQSPPDTLVVHPMGLPRRGPVVRPADQAIKAESRSSFAHEQLLHGIQMVSKLGGSLPHVTKR